MSMSIEEQVHIEQEIQRYYPAPKMDGSYDARKAWEEYQEKLREKVWQVYGALGGDPRSWVLLELIDADTLEMKLVWKKKT